MQDAGFSTSVSSSANSMTSVAASNGQINNTSINSQSKSTQSMSIFGDKSNKANTNINQSNSNSHGTGGLGTIFTGGGFAVPTNDTSSIFAGIKRGSNYSLYSKKDASYDFQKLTPEMVMAQKGLTGPKRTNPKAYNIDLTSKENPYAAFRNPEMHETTLSETFSQLGSKIASIFNQKQAN